MYMSYTKAMKWAKKHPKGIRNNYMGFASGFTPSIGFLENSYWPYIEECKKDGIKPMSCKDYYDSQVRK